MSSAPTTKHVLGRIDFAVALSKLKPGHIWVSGWIVHERQPILSLKVSLDGKRFFKAQWKDGSVVLSAFASLNRRSNVGFVALLPSKTEVGSAVTVFYRATLASSKKELQGVIGNALLQKELRLPESSLSSERYASVIKAKETLARVNLASFLASRSEICFPKYRSRITVSVIIVIHNRADLVLATLQALRSAWFAGMEVVLIDNASTDLTTELLKRVRGAVVRRNRKNGHFIKGANQGARLARGRYFLFLNSDCEVGPGSIEAAIRRIRSSSDIGVVGGKLLNLDGSLQEAGYFVKKDGTVEPIGWGDDPDKPEYQSPRSVAACGGAFFLTPSALFRRLGGFSMRYFPAYFEEMHYCMQVRQLGLKIVYEPEAVAFHFRAASFSRGADALWAGSRNSKVFRDYWVPRWKKQAWPRT